MADALQMTHDDLLIGLIDLAEGRAHVLAREGVLVLLGQQQGGLVRQLGAEAVHITAQAVHLRQGRGQAGPEGVQRSVQPVQLPRDRGQFLRAFREGARPEQIAFQQAHAPHHQRGEILGRDGGPLQGRPHVRPEGPAAHGLHAPAGQPGDAAFRGRVQEPGQAGAGESPARQGLAANVVIEQARALGLAAMGADAVAHALGGGPVPGLFLRRLRALPEMRPGARGRELTAGLIETDEAPLSQAHGAKG